MKHFVKTVLKRPVFTLALLAAVTILMAWQAKGLRFDYSPELIFKSTTGRYLELKRFEANFGGDVNHFLLATAADDVFSPDFLADMKRLQDKIAALPHVDRVDSMLAFLPPGENVESLKDPQKREAFRKKALGLNLTRNSLVSEDGRAAAMVGRISARADQDEARTKLFEEVGGLLKAEEKAGRKWRITGVPVVRTIYSKLLKQDQMIFMPPVLCLFVVILWGLFRRALAVALPILTVGIGLIWTLGLVAMTGGSIQILTSLIPTIILVIGIADSIHFLTGFYRMLEEGKSVEEAVPDTLVELGGACFLTSLTTVIGFLTLTFLQPTIAKEFGFYAAAGIAFSWITTVTLLPCCLALFHRPAKAGSAPRGRTWNEMLQGPLQALARLCVSRRAAIYVFFAAALAFSAVFLQRIRIDTSLMEDIDRNTDIYKATAFVQQKLSGILTLEAQFESKNGESLLTPEGLSAVRSFQKHMASQRDVNKAVSVADLFDAAISMAPAATAMAGDPYKTPGAAQRLAGMLESAGLSGEIRRLSFDGGRKLRVSMAIDDIDSDRIRALADEAEAFAAGPDFGGLKIAVTGTALMAHEMLDKFIVDLVKGFAMAFLCIMGMMFFIFRSARIGVIAMLPNIVPLIMAMGVMGAIGLDLRTSTTVVFVIGLGIAVDDTIHFLSRMRLNLVGGKPYTEAVEDAIKTAGPGVISTTLVLTLGLLVLTLSHFTVTKNFGLLSAIIMVAALAGDLFLLPALALSLRPSEKNIRKLNNRH